MKTDPPTDAPSGLRDAACSAVKCRKCNGFGKKYHKPKGYTCGGHYYDCPDCAGLGHIGAQKKNTLRDADTSNRCGSGRGIHLPESATFQASAERADATKYAEPHGSKERVEEQLRIALDGHPESELWGEHGLIAATMRCVEAVNKIQDLVTTDHETKELFIQRVRGILSLPNANVDLPDTAAQDSASKSNSPAVSG